MGILIPNEVSQLLDKAAEEISLTMNFELWDDATQYMMIKLRNEARNKFGIEIVGSKYLADVREQIDLLETGCRYQVTKRVN